MPTETDVSVRLLIVAYYFPPSGGAGVQRVLKWVKYLPQFGIEPVVLTVKNGAYPSLDPTLTADFSSDLRVIRTASLDPFSIHARLTGQDRDTLVEQSTDDVQSAGGLARWVRGNLLLPDARAGWVPFASLRGLGIRKVDAVLTSGPPHSVHLTGCFLKTMKRIPWVADFRDPWTDIHYYNHLPRTKAAEGFDRFLERRVLKKATRVTTVSPSWARLLSERSGKPVSVIPNGFDEADFRDLKGREPSEEFRIVHVGSLYNTRNPVAFWQAVQQFQEQTGENIRFRAVGRTGQDVKASAYEAGVTADWVLYSSHDEAIRHMQQADLLLLSTEPQESAAGHVTGKVYEYLATGRPILAVGTPDGDADLLLQSTSGGHLFARDDVEGIAAFLMKQWLAWKEGKPLTGASRRAIAPYSRERQAEKLAELVKEMTVARRAE